MRNPAGLSCQKVESLRADEAERQAKREAAKQVTVTFPKGTVIEGSPAGVAETLLFLLGKRIGKEISEVLRTGDLSEE